MVTVAGVIIPVLRPVVITAEVLMVVILLRLLVGLCLVRALPLQELTDHLGEFNSNIVCSLTVALGMWCDDGKIMELNSSALKQFPNELINFSTLPTSFLGPLSCRVFLKQLNLYEGG